MTNALSKYTYIPTNIYLVNQLVPSDCLTVLKREFINMLYNLQCCGSGSGSVRIRTFQGIMIRIRIFFTDPDPDLGCLGCPLLPTKIHHIYLTSKLANYINQWTKLILFKLILITYLYTSDEAPSPPVVEDWALGLFGEDVLRSLPSKPRELNKLVCCWIGYTAYF